MRAEEIVADDAQAIDGRVDAREAAPVLQNHIRGGLDYELAGVSASAAHRGELRVVLVAHVHDNVGVEEATVNVHVLDVYYPQSCAVHRAALCRQHECRQHVHAQMYLQS